MPCALIPVSLALGVREDRCWKGGRVVLWQWYWFWFEIRILRGTVGIGGLISFSNMKTSASRVQQLPPSNYQQNGMMTGDYGTASSRGILWSLLSVAMFYRKRL